MTSAQTLVPAAQPARISFEVNQGQADSRVKFMARHAGMSVSIFADELVLSFAERDREPPQQRRDRLKAGRERARATERTVVRMKLQGADVNAKAIGIDPVPGKTNYLLGSDPAKWRRNVVNYSKVKLENVYPGVDLILRGEGGRLAYDFEVAAGANADVIDLAFEGAQDASVDSKGDLVLRTGKGELRHVAPVSYQDQDGKRSRVGSQFVSKGQRRVGFHVADHDRSRRLVIDPTIIYSTLVGGSLEEEIFGVAADALGNAYVVGSTPSIDFPQTGSSRVPFGYDAFVQKRDAEGGLVYSTIIGGTADESAMGIAVNSVGEASIAGGTFSADFPMRNAVQPMIHFDAYGKPTQEGYVTRLNPTGDDVLSSTYYGGSRADEFRKIAVDEAGNTFALGVTESTDLALLQPLQGGNAGAGDLALVELDPAGGLKFATYLGSGQAEQARGLAVDTQGSAYVLGAGTITGVTNPLWPVWDTYGFSFLAKIRPPAPSQAPAFEYRTRIGYYGTGVGVDGLGNAYVTIAAGQPTQGQGELPVVNAFQPTRAGNSWDAYFLKISASGQSILYATFCGFEDTDEFPDAIAVGLDGRVVISGWSQKRPVYVWPQVLDAWFAYYDTNGIQKTFYKFGDDREDGARALALDVWGNVYVAGYWNHDTRFPPDHEPTMDGFLVKFYGPSLDIPPDCRDCVHDIGLPVNLFTGSVWLNQTDAAIPGVMGITFTRSYNSVGVGEPTASHFGPGWTHPFEQNLGVSAGSAQLRLRQGNGVPMIFATTDGVTFRASVPASETSWIVKASDGYTRYFRGGGSEAYDLQGRLIKVVDVVGNEMTFTWNLALLAAIRDPGGRELQLAYNGSRIASVSGPSGLIASYTYTPGGLLATVAYPDGTGYAYSYDPAGRLLRVTDHAGNPIETHTYDTQGRAITSEVADGVEKYTLLHGAGTTDVTDALGNVAHYEWTKFGGINKVTKRTGACINCGGADTEEWTYYPDGRVHTHKVATDPVTTFTYFPEGEVQTVVDPLNRTTSFTYDSNGRILTSATPGAGTTVYTQSPAGPLTITVPVEGTTTRVTTFTYYPNGKLKTVEDPDHHVTTNFYETIGDLKTVRDALLHETRFTYDAMGRVETVTDPLNHTTRTTYDAVGRVLKVTLHDQTYSEFVYNKLGQRTQAIDPLRRTTLFSYDRFGRLESTVDADKKETRNGYDIMSRLISITDAKKNKTSFDFDAQGRLWHTTYPGGRQEVLTYYPSGRLNTRLDRKSITTTYFYDTGGRLRTTTFSDNSTAVTLDYDDADRVIYAQNGADTVHRTYDLSGALRTETTDRNSNTTRVDYDGVGRRQTLKTGIAETVIAAYEYDEVSRLRWINRGGPRPIELTYDDAGRRSTLTYPNGIGTTYAYNDVNRLTGITALLSQTVINQVGYTYDAAGNRLTKTSPTLAETYKYDNLSRLVSVDRGNNTLSTFGYDAVGNRLTAQAASRVVKATFNDRNELHTEAAGGPLRFRGTLSEAGTATVAGVAATSLPGGVFEASVDVVPGPNDVLVEATDGSGNIRRSTYRVTVPNASGTYDYDLNGNLITRNDGTNVWTFEWTARNELRRVLKDNVEVARFLYDAFGRRVEKVVGTVTTAYIYDGDDILEERINSGPKAGTYRYVHGPGVDEPLSREKVGAGTFEYYHADGLGSITKTTSSAGAVILTRQYDAWGNLESGASEPGYSFTGREWDPEIGLYYYRARYYDPKVGRFIGEDPIGFKGGVNFYGYVGGNPVNFVDPSGRVLRTAALTTMQAIAGGAGARIQIVNGAVDVSQLTQQDLTGNEGALLIHQLATSRFVYTYDEAACPGGVSNLDNRPDWRYRGGKQARFLPPSGVDDAVTVDPSASWVDQKTGLTVSLAATAFHELAEAYAKIDLGLPYMFKGSTAGAHADAVRREQILIGQSPGFTQAPAGGSLRRVR